MTENGKNITNLEFRAKLPHFFRILSALGLGVIVIAIVIGFYFGYGQEDFRMKGAKDLKLSKDVVAEIEGYERRETEGDKQRFYIKADRARTFSDNHQEMDNIFLQVFDEAGEHSDIIKANKAIYIPNKDDPKLFTAFFAGAVSIDSRAGLNVKTDQLTYEKQTETAEAEEFIEFSHENVTGSSIGAIVNVKGQSIELLKDVVISAVSKEGDELSRSKIEEAKITSGHAIFDQIAGKIEFDQMVRINVTPQANSGEFSQPTDLEADRATALFTEQQLNNIELNGNVFVYMKPTGSNPKWTKTRANRANVKIRKELKQLELFENVDIETTVNGSRPTKIKTNYALYEKDAERFELKDGVEILTFENDQPTRISSQTAIYEQARGNIYLTGDARIVRGNDLITGDQITAYLLSNNKLKSANVKGNAYLKQVDPERTAEVKSAELNTIFGENQEMIAASSSGGSEAVMTPSKVDSYTKVSLSTPVGIRLSFQNGLIEQMQTDGRTTISLDAPNNSANASNKRLTADSVISRFSPNGKDLTKAEAVGNAELLITPLRKLPENYQTTIYAPRFDCDFFAGNKAKSCSAATNVKTVRIPTVPSDSRGKQSITAERMNAYFGVQTNGAEKLEAIGNAKFSELDRNGIADQVTFTQSDEVVRLRGGEPTVWDSRARARAGEIDWDTRNGKSYLRGNVSTTYYSQAKTGGATPFTDAKSPVFMTSNEAAFDHNAESGVYFGNARAWQDNNYVRAEKLTIQQKEGKLYGEGTVQSLLYNAKRKEGDRESAVPVYAAADRLFYVRQNNFLRFEGNADIRQATDRILAGSADVYLNDKNEVTETIAEKSVVITQPDRKATGEYAKYDARDESVILRGNPAQIDDRQRGSSQGSQFTFFMRDNKFVSDGKTPENSTGRIRSVYKVNKQD